MKYIDEAKINWLIENSSRASRSELNDILAKSKSLMRLTLEETAVLLCTEDPEFISRIFETAYFVKNSIYGKRIVLFAPLYINNYCTNNCRYCSFKADNKFISRRALNTEEIRQQIEWLLGRGHKRILMVAGEAHPQGKYSVEYYMESIKAIYSASVGENRIRRVNINCAPLGQDEFIKLKTAGIGTYQLFQETYHDETYKYVHPSGPKSDPDNRIDAIDKAFKAGIDDVGIGVLYGLYDFRFDTLAMLMHVEHLEKTYGVGSHTISVPRIEPAFGADLSYNIPYEVSDDDFKKVVAVLRLSVPYTGMILSTRETARFRDELLKLGVSQISAESRTSPGGYAAEDKGDLNGQFSLSDRRSLDEIVGSLLQNGFIPSFCAACYRKDRTGESFMNLAKPGTIKNMCSINALITLKEYLDDFASEKVRIRGYEVIDNIRTTLDKKWQEKLSVFFEDIKAGIRDEYV